MEHAGGLGHAGGWSTPEDGARRRVGHAGGMRHVGGWGASEAAFIARSARSNHRGCLVEAALSLPGAEDTSGFAASGVILRGDSSEAIARITLKINP